MSLGHYDNHPAYRGQGGPFIVQQFKFGRDRTAVPNIEAELSTTAVWFAGAAVAENDAGFVPVIGVYDSLIDDIYGSGLADANLYQPSFDAIKTAQEAAGTLRISIDEPDQTDLRSFLAQLLEYFDGFLVRRGAQIAVGAWKQGNIDTSLIPIVGSNDLTSEPSMTWTGWDDCLTDVNVTFRDRTRYFHDDIPASYKNPGLQISLGEFRPSYIRRPWIIDAAMANTYAAFWGQRFARPGGNGTIDVKLERVEAIEDAAGMPIVGQLIKLDVASWTEEIVVRVVECEYPGDEGPFYCTLTVEIERSIWPILFIQPPPKRLGNFTVTVPKVVNYALWELPSGLKDTAKSGIQISVLSQRPAPNVVGFHAWTSPDNVNYEVLNPPCTFAAYGKIVDETYPSTRNTIDTTLGMHVELFGVDLVPTQTGTQRDDYNWLIFCGVPGVDVFPEIMSVGQVVALGAGKYKVFTRSALYGTVKHGHNIGTKIFFIQRDQLAALGNKNFIKDATLWYKLQTYDNHQSFDLADFTGFQYAFGGGAVGTPTLNNPTTDFVITTEGKVNSRITATWSYILDQDIIGFNARVRRLTFDSQWITHSVSIVTSDIFQNLEPNRLYEVQIQARSKTDESAWSASKQITTAAPNVPGTPSGLSLTPVVNGVVVKWTPATTGGIRGTIILFSAISGSDIHLVEIDEVSVGEVSYRHIVEGALIGAPLFYTVKHINTLGIDGAHPTAMTAKALSEAALVKLPEPFIAKSDLEGGTAGDADYRLQLVNTSAGQSATLQFSYNKTTWTTYSATGNYRDGISGSVLPTTNVGEISLSAGGQLFARQTQDGFLTSELADFYNNTSKTPHSDGTGGSDGTPGKNLP